MACEPDDTPLSIVTRIAPQVNREFLRVAIDSEFATWDTPMGNAREIAFLPPFPEVDVMEIDIQFTAEPIVIPPENRPSREIGAVVEFHGIVREMEGEQAQEGLFYEAYETMARKVLQRHLVEFGGDPRMCGRDFHPPHRLGACGRGVALPPGGELALGGSAAFSRGFDRPAEARLADLETDQKENLTPVSRVTPS